MSGCIATGGAGEIGHFRERGSDPKFRPAVSGNRGNKGASEDDPPPPLIPSGSLEKSEKKGELARAIPSCDLFGGRGASGK